MTHLISMLAVVCCGVFFGAAIYISLAQHPALRLCNIALAREFFTLMYHRAAPMQITLALGGAIAGATGWIVGMGMLWLVGAACLILVIPITLIWIKPINDKLLNAENTLSENEIDLLLLSWGRLHWLRNIASGVAFGLYLIAIA